MVGVQSDLNTVGLTVETEGPYDTSRFRTQQQVSSAASVRGFPSLELLFLSCTFRFEDLYNQ